MADEYDYQVYNSDTTAAQKSRRSRRVQEEPSPKKKKGHPIRNLLLFLLILAVLAAVLLLLFFQPPAAAEGHRDGAYTLLLAGTDGDGTRTDTMMLVYIDTDTGELSLLSIPRDTLVSLSMSVPKLNGVYGQAGTGEAGMEALMEQVTLLLGYRPDGYVLVNFDAVEEIVDILGGVEFDVPVDMEYSDPAQDLYISLSAGLQTLTGEQALWVLRYRSGYALADLDRVAVQRELVQAMAEQCLSLSAVTKLPQLLAVYQEDVLSDLSFRNLVGLAMAVMRCDIENAAMNTLPGEAVWYSSGSYYQVDLEEAAELLNSSYNPLETEITTADLLVVNVVSGSLVTLGGASAASESSTAAESSSADSSSADSSTAESSTSAGSTGSGSTGGNGSSSAGSTQAAPAESAPTAQTGAEAAQGDGREAEPESTAEPERAAETESTAETETADTAAEPEGGAAEETADPAPSDSTAAEADTAGDAGAAEEAEAEPEIPESDILPTE